MAIERALLSVSDKSGIVEFAKGLVALRVEIVSTGGTAGLLRQAGVAVREVAELTGWPEMFEGRVKTLHPSIHGGILFRRGLKLDREQAHEHGIVPIDLVVVNLYPFAAAARKKDASAEALIENVDIGGPALVRSAAKNFNSVAVVIDPVDYPGILEELARCGGLSLPRRLELARKAFALTASYDAAIATEFERAAASDQRAFLAERPLLPERLRVDAQRRQVLRYGENPHQAAALYLPAGRPAVGLAGARQLQGKELSYNNLVDLDAAWSLVQEFSRPAAAIIKHTNPCGVAEHDRLADAYRKAYECDTISAYGGVLAFNRPLDGETAGEVAKLFVECIVAPGCEASAQQKLAAKKNLRLLVLEADAASDALELKCISGGWLAQQPDRHILQPADLKVVTQRAPSPAEQEAMGFAWKVCKHVKSNAIVFARDSQAVGIGAGQMSRVDAVKLAVMRAQLPLAESVVASDAFFPFVDGVAEAAKAGATAVIQPGGSVRDLEVIAAADKLGLAMVFTGVRHFRH